MKKVTKMKVRTLVFPILLVGAIAIQVVAVSATENTQSNSDSKTEAQSEDNKKPVVRFNPPEERGREQRTRAGGSRGCPEQIDTELVLLAPQNSVAMTASTNPTFYVYLDSIPNTQLRYSLGNDERILVDRTITVNESGIIPLEIDSETDSLTGGRYNLTVGLVCQGGSPIDDKHLQVELVKVDGPVLEDSNFVSNSPLERIKILAENGIWYDALKDAYYLEDKSIFFSLLEQINLKELSAVQ